MSTIISGVVGGHPEIPKLPVQTPLPPDWSSLACPANSGFPLGGPRSNARGLPVLVSLLEGWKGVLLAAMINTIDYHNHDFCRFPLRPV